jgi:cell wall-associated NlpC family hydrolase
VVQERLSGAGDSVDDLLPGRPGRARRARLRRARLRRDPLAPRDPRIPRLLVGLVAALALVAVPVLSGLQADAARKPTVAEAAKNVATLRDQAEQATERYNALREQLSSLAVRKGAAQSRLAAQQTRVAAARAALGRVVAETYKQGDLSGLALFLSDDPDSALEQNGVLATLGERRNAAVQQLRDEEARLAASRDDLAQQQRRITAATADLSRLRTTVAAKLKAAQAQLARLQAADRAAVERLLAGDDPRITCAQAGVDLSGRVGKVLAYACAQLGEPYVWAAAGPGSFDCSGLTMRAWEAAGVSLPHNADAQSHFGQRVAPTAAALQPGDLVFFHGPISHVGIYIGRGLMIHAPHTGTVVKIATVQWAAATAAARY